MVHVLVYISAAAEPLDDAALVSILHQARTRNAVDGLTGMLVHRGGRFMQLLEGPRDAVIATYARVLNDARHDEIQLLVEEDVGSRRFPGWTMAYDRESSGTSDPEGFSAFLEHGDGSSDHSRPRELLRWFRNHPLADPTNRDH